MKKDAKKPGCRNWLTADKDRSRWQHFLEEGCRAVEEDEEEEEEGEEDDDDN
jgi:hypothetical protein